MSEQRRRMRDGEWYLPGALELVAERDHARERLALWQASAATDRVTAEELLRELFGELGEDAEVVAPFFCDYGSQISIGPRSFVNTGAVFLDSAPIRIGADVQLGPRVQLLTPTHPLDGPRRREGWERAEPIVIEDGAWLAAGVIVCPGVTIGADAVIGAGSVVLADMPAGHLCVGTPCRPLRRVSESDADRPIR
jgi:maltose O-acetyltransferase